MGHTPRRTLFSRTRCVPPRAMARRPRHTIAALCVFPVWRRSATVYWQHVCDRGGRTSPRDYCSALQTRPGPGPDDQPCPDQHPAPGAAGDDAGLGAPRQTVTVDGTTSMVRIDVRVWDLTSCDCDGAPGRAW